MKFKCKVITRASKNQILGITNLNQLKFDFDNSEDVELLKIKVYLTAIPVNNKANKKLIELLSKELKISKSNIKIIKGEKNKEKIIAINE